MHSGLKTEVQRRKSQFTLVNCVRRAIRNNAAERGQKEVETIEVDIEGRLGFKASTSLTCLSKVDRNTSEGAFFGCLPALVFNSAVSINI
jgi:hypothetical protein